MRTRNYAGRHSQTMPGKNAVLLLIAVLLLCTGCEQTVSYSGQGVRPGYTLEEPGHWEQTDVLYFGPNEETRQEDGMTVAAGWDEDRNMVYTFTGADGSKAVFTVDAYWFSESYYASSSVQPGVNIIRDADTEDTPGNVVCSLAVADITPGEGKYGVKVDVREYFKTQKDATPIERFSIGENMTESTGYDGKKYYLSPNAFLPEGTDDGEKIYLVLGAMDGGEGTTRMYTAWEYTWRAEPETIVVPDEYGPIEEFTASAPGINYVVLALCVLIPAGIFVGILILIKRGINKRQNKRNGGKQK